MKPTNDTRLLPDDETCWGDPRSPEEIEQDIACSQPGYVRSDPFAHDGTDACMCGSCYLARKERAAHAGMIGWYDNTRVWHDGLKPLHIDEGREGVG